MIKYVVGGRGGSAGPDDKAGAWAASGVLVTVVGWDGNGFSTIAGAALLCGLGWMDTELAATQPLLGGPDISGVEHLEFDFFSCSVSAFVDSGEGPGVSGIAGGGTQLINL